MEPLIRLQDVERYYDTPHGRTYVLRRIQLTVRRGQFVTIMGPSGAGKSSLLHILGLLDDGWKGEYLLEGQAVHELSRKRRTQLHRETIGFVFQRYHLLEDLTVYENLELPLSYQGVSRRERQARVADVLDRFRIVAKRDLYPPQLSGGQQQLVAVARAVITRPSLILADEPTGNLHSSQGEEIMELFRELNEEGTTIVQVTHSEANAAYGDTVVQLLDGWVVED